VLGAKLTDIFKTYLKKNKIVQCKLLTSVSKFSIIERKKNRRKDKYI